MKNIVFFSHGLSANGIETFLVNVIENLDKKKYNITVIIAIDDGVECLHEPKVSKMGVTVIHAGDLDSVSKKLKYVQNVKKVLKKGNFDIAHSNMDLLNGITLHLAKKAGIPVRICHAHTSKSQYKASGLLAGVMQIVQKKYYNLMKSLIIKSSTELVACSDGAGEYFYDDHDYKTIFNGIDMKKFSNADDIDKSSLGIRVSKKHNLVSVGRITMAKNPIFALEIIKELKKLRNDFSFAWVGTGELETEAKSKAKEFGIEDCVDFTGLRTDIPQILSVCDCFLMPSLFEGLPFSLVEAQAAGLRCIVSDVVTKAADIGLCSYFSLNESAEKWANFIDAKLDSPLPEVDEEKKKLFDISNTVRQLEEIYDN